MAAMQDELGEKCVTAVVSFDSSQEGGHVHFEVRILANSGTCFVCTKQHGSCRTEPWDKCVVSNLIHRRVGGRRLGGKEACFYLPALVPSL